MLKVPIDQTKPGMTLARAVVDPTKPDLTLLKTGVELDDGFINRLRELKVGQVWIHYPGLDFLDEVIDPELINKQQELYKLLKEDFSDAQDGGLAQINYKDYTEKMSEFFQRIFQQGGVTSSFIDELHGESEDIHLHGVRVASLAILLGIKLQNYLVRERARVTLASANDLTQLGIGCMLHDVGKLTLPEEIQGFHMTAQDLGAPEWQKHTEVGFKMIRQGLNPLAAQVVINHHQHFDGSGFPKRKILPGMKEPSYPLKGEEIHIFCRVATLADRFEGLRYLPDGRIAPNVVALKRMKNPGYAKWFDPKVYRAFTEAMPAFNLGEQVVLNDNREVVVVQLNESQPCRPIVRPVELDKAVDKNKKNESEDETPVDKDIDLSLHPDLYVARVGDFDVTPYLH